MKLMKAGAVQVVVLVVAMLAAIGVWEVSKAVVGPAHGGTPPPLVFDHFTCYRLNDALNEADWEAKVQIQNQFETSVSRVDNDGRLLCTPTAKRLISVTVKPPHKGDREDDKDRKGEREDEKERKGRK